MVFAERHRQSGDRLRLNGRNLFIIPTGFGWLWLAGVAVLQLVGIQQQSNGALLMSFLLLGLFVLALHLTALNLHGLELACGQPAAGFAGAPLAYPLQIHSRCHRYQLELSFEAEQRNWGLRQATGGREGLTVETGERWLAVAWMPRRRGLQRPGTLRLRSTAPLGLFRCWALWQPDVTQLVYPARTPGPVLEQNSPFEAADGAGEATDAADGSGDWCDLRPHRSEEGVARLAWKSLARGRGAHSKLFEAPKPRVLWLAPLPGIEQEQALEHLCARLWTLSASGEPFGLALGEQRIGPGTGPRHRDRCLAALALGP
jgi:uncharacterized protein (DUF58 family)